MISKKFMAVAAAMLGTVMAGNAGATEYKPREAPILSAFFNHSFGKGRLYAAPLLDVKSVICAQMEQSSSDFVKEMEAYQNDKGDTLFQACQDWYVLPAGGAVAYKLWVAAPDLFAHNPEDSRPTVDFRNEARDNGPHIGTLRGFRELGGGLQIVSGDMLGLEKTDVGGLASLHADKKQKLLQNITGGRITFVGLPETRSYVFGGTLKSGGYIAVSKTSDDTHEYRLFKGPSPDRMQEIKVNNILKRDKDYSVFIDSDEGTLMMPKGILSSDTLKWQPGKRISTDGDALGWKADNFPAEKIAWLGSLMDLDTFVNDNRIEGTRKWSEVAPRLKR